MDIILTLSTQIIYVISSCLLGLRHVPWGSKIANDTWIMSSWKHLLYQRVSSQRISSAQGSIQPRDEKDWLHMQRLCMMMSWRGNYKHYWPGTGGFPSQRASNVWIPFSMDQQYVDSPHKGPAMRALLISLLLAWRRFSTNSHVSHIKDAMTLM